MNVNIPTTKIVFIVIDDLDQKDIGIEGSPFYEIPNIDELAASEVLFKNGYMTEVCSLSRGSIMLGKYPARIGTADWISAATGSNWNRNDRMLSAANMSSLPHKDISLAEAMKAAGYKTIFAGK